MKSCSSNALATTTKRAPKAIHPEEKAQGDEVVLGLEVIERLKSWCYV